MIYLVLAILSSLTNSILIKLNEVRRENTAVILASNYIIAMLLGWGFVFWQGMPTLSGPTLWLGAGGGVLWPSTFFVYMWGIRHYGISLAGSIRRLSLLVPVLFAILFLQERLTILLAGGIMAAFFAFFLISPIRKKEVALFDQKALVYFPLLVLMFGVVELWVNLFNTLGNEAERFLFLALIFTFSLIFSWCFLWLRRMRVTKTAVFRGLILGFPNYLTTLFLLEALKNPFFQDRSAIVYSLYSVAGVLLAFIVGVTIWRERVPRTAVWGILAAITAIILINLSQ